MSRGMLDLVDIAVIPGVSSGLTFGSALWPALLLAGILCGLGLYLAAGVLRNTKHALFDERQNAVRLQQACQRERALNEWRDQALQDLNHELRIPLTQIDGYLELLETYRDHLDASTQARFIALARSGCDELLHLLRTSMETLQTSTTQPRVHCGVFSLSHEVQRALAHCDSRLLEDHRIESNIADTVQVYADALLVRQVVRNLLTNACKYTPAGSSIVVSAVLMSKAIPLDAETRMVCVRVLDEGPGIPLDEQVSVFERFARRQDATTSAQPGSGLGLAICKQLVEAMGGTIWVDSTGQNGEGCCFSFTLMSAPQWDALDSTELVEKMVAK